MSEMTEKQPVTNAICITLYHPEGREINSKVRQAAEEAVEKLAQEHGLFVNVATT